MLTVSAEQNTPILVNGRITDSENAVLNGPQAGRLRKTSSRTGWLRKHLLEVDD